MSLSGGGSFWRAEVRRDLSPQFGAVTVRIWEPAFDIKAQCQNHQFSASVTSIFSTSLLVNVSLSLRFFLPSSASCLHAGKSSGCDQAPAVIPDQT